MLSNIIFKTPTTPTLETQLEFWLLPRPAVGRYLCTRLIRERLATKPAMRRPTPVMREWLLLVLLLVGRCRLEYRQR